MVPFIAMRVAALLDVRGQRRHCGREIEYTALLM